MKPGQIIDCPFCYGTGKWGNNGKRKCPTCEGEGRVEYQEEIGLMRAQPGTTIPTKFRGTKTGRRVVLFGAKKVEEKA